MTTTTDDVDTDTAPPPVEALPAPLPADVKPDPDPALADPGKRALAAERKERAAERRRADDAERRLAELERERMSDAEKTAADRDGWRKKYEEQSATLAAREMAILRTEVATEKGLTLAQARRLIGGTREELEQDADAFKAELPTNPAYPPNTPRPDPSQGPSVKPGGRATSVAQAMAEHAARITRATPTS